MNVRPLAALALALVLAGCASSDSGAPDFSQRDGRLLTVRSVRVLWRTDDGRPATDPFAEGMARAVAARLATDGFRSVLLMRGNSEKARPIEVLEVARSTGEDLAGLGDSQQLGKADAYILLRVQTYGSSPADATHDVQGLAYTRRSDGDGVVEDEVSRVRDIPRPSTPAELDSMVQGATKTFFFHQEPTSSR